MNVEQTRLAGVVIIEPKVFGDARGFFMESYAQQRYAQVGITERFVQDNVSRSARNVLRGLHLQNPRGQGKLVHVLQGAVFDVAVDVRVGSPTFGRWVGVELSGENHRQLYIPPGFAHGFAVLSETALFAYKCTDYYSPADELGVRWNDSAVGIDWPVSDPTVSDKDAAYPELAQIEPASLPTFEGGAS